MADDLADALASSVGGVVTVAVTYPIEIVKNRIASEASSTSGGGGDEPPSALAVARGILAARGPLGFYDGVVVSAVQNAVEKFLYFFAYSAARRALAALRGGPSFASDLVAGCAAEVAHLPVSVPLETLLIRVVNDPQLGALAAARKLLQERGIGGLYAGSFVSALLSVKPAIQLATFEAVRARLLRRRPGEASLSAAQAFCLGAAARALATVLVFPYIRAKFMLKNMAGEVGEAPAWLAPLVHLHSAMGLVLRRQGLGGLYQGLAQELARATTSAALLMAVRERLTLLLKAALAP